MAFTEADRVQIRMYLGFGSLYLQTDPRLESAITAIQSIADGGSRPDTSAETQMRSILTKLQSTDTSIDLLDDAEGAGAVDEIKIDTSREHARLRQKGSMYVARLARMVDVEAYVDPYYNTVVRLSSADRQRVDRTPY